MEDNEMELGYTELLERTSPGIGDKIRNFYWAHEGHINGIVISAVVGICWAGVWLFAMSVFGN